MQRLDAELSQALKRLGALLGDEKASQLFADCMAEAKVSALSSPQDQLAFAERLCRRGGFVEVVGRSIKVRALLRGATVGAPD